MNPKNEPKKDGSSDSITVEEIAKAATIAAMAGSTTAVLLGADPSILWALANILQMYYYLLFVNTKYPENL